MSRSAKFCNRIHTDLTGRRICSREVFAEGFCRWCFHDYCDQQMSIEICTLLKRKPRRRPTPKKRLLDMNRFIVTTHSQCSRIVEDSLYGNLQCDQPVYLNGLCKEHAGK